MDKSYKAKIKNVLAAKMADIQEAFEQEKYYEAKLAAAKLSYWIGAVEEYDLVTRRANEDAAALLQ